MKTNSAASIFHYEKKPATFWQDTNDSAAKRSRQRAFIPVMLPLMPRASTALLCCLLWASALLHIQAHPIPDIPVRGSFDDSGKAVIKVEIDPRCFEADPNTAPSVWKIEFETLPEEKRQALQDKAKAYIVRSVAFSFPPGDKLAGEFDFAFTGQNEAPLVKNDDVVVLTGTWKPTLPPGTTGYQLHALAEGKLSVLFLNKLRGQEVERIGVLFPGESSYVLDLTTPKPVTTSATEPGRNGQGWMAIVVAMIAAVGLWWGAQA
jgi:hypothetical protein